jgi:hypothetical protein
MYDSDAIADLEVAVTCLLVFMLIGTLFGFLIYGK